MTEQLSRIGALKIIEVIATSITLVGVLIYFSGYQILAGFLEHQFGQTFFFGALLPPVIFAYLGLILLLNLIFSFPIIWICVFGDIGLVPEEAIDMVLGISFAVFFVRTDLYKFLISKYLPWYVIPLVVFLALYFIIRMVYSYKKKGPNYKLCTRIKISFKTKLLSAILLPILYPAYIKYISSEQSRVISEIRLSTVYDTFLLPSVASLALFMVALRFIRSYTWDDWNWLKAFLTFSYLASFIYGFSSIIGISISESYKQKSTGIFPVVNILTTENLFIPGTKDKEFSFFLIAKDNDFYYGFQAKSNRILVVPVSKVLSAQISAK